MKENQNVIDALRTFVLQKGFVTQGKPPKQNEPYYEEFIAAKMIAMGISRGDEIEIDIKYAKIRGVLLDKIYKNSIRIDILVEGKKVWKTKKNVKSICLSDIVDIHIIEKSNPDFNIKNINPYYHEIDLEEIHKIHESQQIDDELSSLLNDVYPARDDKTVFMNIAASLFCPEYYQGYGGTENKETNILCVHVTVTYKNGTIKTYGNLKIRHVFPNHDYSTACESRAKSESLIIPFASFEELSKVKAVTCAWDVMIQNEVTSFVHIVYVDFIKHEKYPIYNVVISTAPLEEYAISLNRKTVFSGRLYESYVFAGFKAETGEIEIVKNTIDKETEDRIRSGVSSNKNDIEIFVQKEKVNGLYYLAKHMDGIEKTEIDFKDVLKGCK